MHIFLIDDNSTSVFLTERLLKREEDTDQISSFLSAHDALNALQQLLPNEVPEVIFLDLNMPVMDGWEFLEALKPYEQDLQGRCSIYILTSSLAPSDTSKSREYSLVTGLVSKPLDRNSIQKIRRQQLSR